MLARMAGWTGVSLANSLKTIHLPFVATGCAMAIVLCISSQVARGAVGNSAARLPLERLGHEVWEVPTIVLSNHPGHIGFGGTRIEPGALREMIDALDDNGWLGEIDAVMTGYLPGAEHVAFAARTVSRVRTLRPDVLCLCDPALGDEPKGVYIDAEAAAAIRSELLPLAGIATPNRFELEWLTEMPVTNTQQAIAAARTLGPAPILVTSVPGDEPDTLVNLLVDEAAVWQTTVVRRKSAPHGTGDVKAALYLGHRLNGASPQDALALATAGLEAVLERSGNADELALVAAQDDWSGAPAWPIEEVLT